MAQNDDPEALLSELLSAGVLVEDGDDLALTEAFESERADRTAELSDADEDDRDTVRERVAEPLGLDVEMVDRHLAATTQAVEALAGFDTTAAARVAVSLKRFDGPPPSNGAPEGFTPITGEEIPPFLDEHPAAVVYFWREDCPSCDELRDDIEELQDSGQIPDEVALASVYGPGSPQFLRAEYDVAVAPTVLFCANGRIDSRLVGVHQPSSYAEEIQIITAEAEFD
jgi:thiol-disulfide isomerase/thioredoxin